MASKKDYSEETKATRTARARKAESAGVANDMVAIGHYVQQILGWVHVGESYLAATRAVIGKVKGGWPAVKATLQDRAHRRHFFRLCLYIHRRNRDEYRYVMRGYH